ARRLLHLLVKRLHHAGGFLATRHAQVQPLFLAGEDRAGIILAVIAALAAVLLRHRRHQLPAYGLRLGQRHALGQRQRLVVPGRTAVIVLGGRGRRAVHQGGRLLVAQRRHARAFERDKAGEEAVEPFALLRRERRALRNQRRKRRRHV